MSVAIGRSQPRILVVDDELSIRRSLAAYLEDCDFDVVLAGSGEEALDLLAEEAFHVAVIDLRLPGMSGDALILKSREMAPDMRFLIHTGSSCFHIPEELKHVGLQPGHIFLKPMADLARLVETIENLVNEVNK